MLRSSRVRFVEACIRGLLLFGLAGVLWSAVTLPAFWVAVPAKDVAVRILAGDRFKSGALSDVLALMQGGPEPVVKSSAVLRAEALIRLRIAKEAIVRRAPDEADNDTAVADDGLKFALALNPQDSFLWLMLYSMEVARNGFDAQTVGILACSYATGPLEGWIALRRNRVALATLVAVDDKTRAAVSSEFASMVDSNFIDDAASNLMSVGWDQRDWLLASLARTGIMSRESLARRLLREGIKIQVPGVTLDERLWRQ